jgi:hypothetical protein
VAVWITAFLLAGIDVPENWANVDGGVVHSFSGYFVTRMPV